jgi:hypothetical protein
LANSLWSEETVFLVRVHTDIVRDENGRAVGQPAEVDSLGNIVKLASVETAPVEHMYEVRTSSPSRVGRVAIVYALGDYASVTNWGVVSH